MKRLLLFFACLFLLPVLCLSTAYLFRDELIHPFLTHAIANLSEKHLGARIRVGRVGGDYFTSLTLESIHLEKPMPYTPLTVIDIDRIDASFDLFQLLSGYESFRAGARVKATGVTIDIDTDRQIGKSGSRSAHGERFSFDFFRYFPRVDAEKANVDIHGRHYAVLVHEAVGSLEPVAGPKAVTRVNAHSNSFRLQVPEVIPIAGEARASVTFDGGRILVHSGTVGDDLALTDGLVDLENVLHDNLHVATTLRHRQTTATGTISILNKFLPASLSITSGDIGPFLEHFPIIQQRLSGRFSGESDFEIDLNASPALKGDAAILLQSGQINDIPVDRAEGDISLREDRFEVSHFAGMVTKNNLKVTNLVLPRPLHFADARALVAQAEGEISLHSEDLPALDQMFGGSQPAAVAEIVAAHRLDLTATADQGTLTVTSGSFVMGSEQIIIDRAGLNLAPADHPLEETRFSLTAAVTVRDFARLARLFRLAPLKGAGTLTIDAAGSLAAPEGKAAFSAKDLEIAGYNLGSVDGRLEGSSGGIRVADLTLRRPGAEIGVDGEFEPMTRKIKKMHMRFLGPGVLQLFPAGIDLARNVPIRDLRGVLVLKEENRLEIHELAATLANTTLQARGVVDLGRPEAFPVTIDALSLAWPEGGATLAAPAQGRFALDGSYSIANLPLQGPWGTVTVRGEGKGTKAIEFSLDGRHLQSKGLPPVVLGQGISFADADVNLQVRGIPSAPVMTAEGTFGSLGNPGHAINVGGRFHFTITPEGIKVRTCELFSPQQDRIALTGDIPYYPFNANPFLPGPLAVKAEMTLPHVQALHPFVGNWLPDQGTLSAVATIDGNWNHPGGRLHLAARELVLPKRLPFTPPRPLDLVVDMELSEKMFTVTRIQASSADLTATTSGLWTNPPSLARLLQGDLVRPFGELDLSGEITVPDVTWLADHFKEVRRVHGALHGLFTMKGQADRPAVHGNIDFKEGQIRISREVPPIRELALDASIEGHILVIRRLTGDLGGSPFTVQGKVDFASMATPVFALALHGDNLLLFRGEGVKLRADSDLTLQGPLNSLALKGELFITEGEYTNRYDFLNLLRNEAKPKGGPFMDTIALHDPPLNNLRYDIHLKEKKPFVLRNNITIGSVRPDLYLRGTGDMPYLTGTVFVEPTKVILPAGRMQIESGLIRFSESNPDSPELDLIGKTKMMGYDITAAIQGVYDEPVVHLSSAPPLPEQELAMLVLTGIRPKQTATTGGSSQQSAKVVVFLGRDYLRRWFAMTEEGEDESFLERLSFDIGRGVTRRGDDTIEANFQLRKDMFAQGDALFLTAEKDVFDDFNMGMKLLFQFR